MIFLYCLLLLFVILIILYLFAIAPSSNLHSVEEFRDVRFAHRGLHGNGVPENSMKAFSLAAEKGFGIELDIHLTKDNRVVVIHDYDTKRVCGKSLCVEDSTYIELCGLWLENTNQKIPLFEDVLKLVDGKIPILVELKSKGTKTTLCPFAAKTLDDYKGKYCIESFSPFIVSWFFKNRKNVVRGQLSQKMKTVGGNNFKNKLLGFILTNLLTNFITRPTFIAYNYKDVSNLSVKLCKNLFKTPIFAWTLKGAKIQKNVEGNFFAYIFEQ
ncbi:MAG: glycerophosphodiester phosphodiesterase family protein [Oscillospiraceae bacterium]